MEVSQSQQHFLDSKETSSLDSEVDSVLCNCALFQTGVIVSKLCCSSLSESEVFGTIANFPFLSSSEVSIAMKCMIGIACVLHWWVVSFYTTSKAWRAWSIAE